MATRAIYIGLWQQGRMAMGRLQEDQYISMLLFSYLSQLAIHNKTYSWNMTPRSQAKSLKHGFIWLLRRVIRLPLDLFMRGAASVQRAVHPVTYHLELPWQYEISPHLSLKLTWWSSCVRFSILMCYLRRSIATVYNKYGCTAPSVLSYTLVKKEVCKKRIILLNIFMTGFEENLPQKINITLWIVPACTDNLCSPCYNNHNNTKTI